MKVAVLGSGGSDSREVRIARAMAKGARHHGHKVIELDKIPPEPVGDVLISYGWIHELSSRLFTKYKEAGKHYVFVDLGYWGRSQSGYHRVSVNDWDSLHTLRSGMPDDRVRQAKKALRHDWDSNSKQVLIAGMSAKAARTHGYKYQQHERALADAVSCMLTQHRVSIRQKPRKSNKADKQPPITEALKSCYFVASHHSNVSIDCLWAGIPYWCAKGAGKRLSVSALTASVVANVEPSPLEVRYQLLADIAYVQYDLDEMSKGVCWDYIKDFML